MACAQGEKSLAEILWNCLRHGRRTDLPAARRSLLVKVLLHPIIAGTRSINCLAQDYNLYVKSWRKKNCSPAQDSMYQRLPVCSCQRSGSQRYVSIPGSETSAFYLDAENRLHPCLPVRSCQLMCLRDCVSILACVRASQITIASRPMCSLVNVCASRSHRHSNVRKSKKYNTKSICL